MTEQSFTNDQGNQGTTGTGFASGTDNSNNVDNDSGSNLQQQIDVMQKRIGDKDSFIDTLKEENQKLREEMTSIATKVESMGSVEDQLKRMEEAKNSNQDTTLDEETLVSKILGTLEAKTTQEVQDKNFKEVSETLVKTYGADKVDDVVRQAAAKVNLKFDDMLELAKKSPKAVYEMVGVTRSAPASATPSQSTHVGYTTDNQTKEQKLAYFSKLRKDNPKEYFKPETQKAFRETCLSK